MVKHTAKVDRGLALMRSLLTDALDDSKPPASSIVAGWKKSAQADFNAAMEWIEYREQVRTPAVETGVVA